VKSNFHEGWSVPKYIRTSNSKVKIDFGMFPSGKTLPKRHRCKPDEEALVLRLGLLGQVW